MNLIIRDYKQSDKNAVLRLLQLNTPLYFDIKEEQDLVYYLDYEIDNYFIVESNNELIGSGGINFKLIDDKRIGIISWDLIHPDYQGKGIGRKLLEYRLEILKNDLSLTEIIVRTSQHVFKFYENSGFKLKEVIYDYWSEGYDLYAMQLEKN
jgi:ribosomal-protein-alanine N-acetyltransferase